MAGCICGLPIGLFVTKVLDVQISKFIALALILILSVFYLEILNSIFYRQS